MGKPTKVLDYKKAYLDLVFDWADVHERHLRLVENLDAFLVMVRLGDFATAEKIRGWMLEDMKNERLTG